MINSLFGDGTCSWVMIVNGTNKYVTEMTEETQKNHIDDIGDSTGILVAGAGPKKHQCHSVIGFSSNQVSTTRVVSKCQRRWSNCFDTIQYFEKKTDQSKSESCHRCFVQNLRLARIGQFERVWITCKKDEVPGRDFSIVWIHTLLIPSCTFPTIQGHSGGKHTIPAFQDNVLLPSVFAEHIYNVGSSYDTHSIIQSGFLPGGNDVKKRETCAVLYGREPNVHRSLSRKGLRRDEAQDCSVQTQLENTSKHSVLV